MNSHTSQQIIATIASSFLCLCGGLVMGYNAALMHQLLVDDILPFEIRDISWLAPVTSLSFLVSTLCVGSFLDIFGRKRSHILLVFPYVIGWIFIVLATNYPQLILGMIMTGICAGATRPTSLVYLAEITEPKYRSMSLLCCSMAFNFGVLFSHLLGFYVNWRIEALMCCFPSLIFFILMLFLKESPLWLISKGKINAGIASFEKFRGKGEAADEELKTVLDKQKDKKTEHICLGTLEKLFSRQLLKAYFTAFLLFLAVEFSGANTLLYYSHSVLRDAFGDKLNPFLVTIITDCVHLFSSIILCLFGRMLPRKTTSIICGFGLTLSLCGFITYSIQLQIFHLTYFFIILMVMCIGFASALISLSWAFVAEIFPTEVRGLGSGLSSAIFCVLMLISIPASFSMWAMLDEVIIYSIYATITLFVTIGLCFILPETNGKTLQDIEISCK